MLLTRRVGERDRDVHHGLGVHLVEQLLQRAGHGDAGKSVRVGRLAGGVGVEVDQADQFGLVGVGEELEPGLAHGAGADLDDAYRLSCGRHHETSGRPVSSMGPV